MAILGARGLRAAAGSVLVTLSLVTVGCGRSDGSPTDTTSGSSSPGSGGGDRISEGAQAQIAALLAEKAARSPALHKVDSHLVYALKMRRGEAIAPGVLNLDTKVDVDVDGSVVVEIDVRDVGPVVLLVEKLGGTVFGSYPKFGGVTARVPLTAIETLAAEPAVKFVREYMPPVLNREDPPGAPPVGKSSEPVDTRSLFKPGEKGPGSAPVPAGLPTGGTDADDVAADIANTSSGVTVHRANVAQTALGANGQGIQVGVLSDSVRYLTSVQGLGDLPSVTVLPGQAGPTGTGEGTAMLEIVHDMAPSSGLYFATAFNGVASFATNILSLRSAGCDVIVDDVFYFNESPFQDGPIAQAVNAVVTDGAVYLSSAGNAGSLLKSTAGVYEGNFVDSGTSLGPLAGVGLVNQFAGGLVYDEVTAVSGTGPYTLFWTDPLGSSSNDYDLFVLDNTLTTLVASSTNIQSGSQDPYEQVSQTTPTAGQRIVIVKKVGSADRYLHLNGNRHRLAVSTTGQTKGHSAAVGAFSVAATPAAAAIASGHPTGPYPGVFTGSNVLENYSSDGARRIFYNSNGTLANSGNASLLADGGVVRQKPDITAADGVDTATPGFGLFYGTSAAAPHAAGIVAQMLSVVPSATGAQIRAALTSSAIDIEGAGTDINAGAGIVMSDNAVSALLSSAVLSLGAVTATPTNGSDGVLDPGENGTLTIQLKNTSSVGASGLNATLSSSNPNVTITQASSAYPDLAAGGAGTNTTAYAIHVSSTALCGEALGFTLTVTGAGADQAFDFDVLTGALGSAPVTFAYAGGATPIPDGTGIESPGIAATATITVPTQTAAVGSLTFRLNGTASSTTTGSTTVGLDHSFVGDLALTLTSPSGTTVPLITRMNAFAGNQSGNNFYNTVLSDSGATSIQAAATAPFTGTFKPVGSLASFAGEDPTGVWTLTARDFVTADTGNIRAFSLVLTPRVCTVFTNQGATCTMDSECSTGHCVDGVCCDTACGGNSATDCQACDATGTCGAAPSSTVCRASANECDLEETCGGATTCPTDASKMAGTTCGLAPSGLCDLQDTCSGGTGATATCVPNLVSAGTGCRASAGGCDTAEACTGSSPDCPADGFVSAGTECRASAGGCDVAEACTGSSAACPNDGFVAVGTECRASIGACDVAETCTGTASCPADAAQPVGTPCGGLPSGLCDAQDTCSGDVGATAFCAPKFLSASTECRPVAGNCDVAESCTGSAADCPTDGFVQGGTECRASAGACDVAEACTGSAAACPNDGLVGAGTECRASIGDCDAAEACTGSGATCPPDAAQPVGTACGGSPNGDCDAQDTCTGDIGATATCAPKFLPSSTTCRPSAGACDILEQCTGNTTTCPTDGFVSGGTVCRGSVGDCDVAEACSGSSAACPADAAQPAGTSCGGAPNGDCDAQDTCIGDVGATATCAPKFLPSSTTCRPVAGDCDVAENCTGNTTTCPTNGFLSGGTVCRGSVGDCDVTEACTGSTATCPADAAQPTGTACGGAPNGDCDAQDTCSGNLGATATCVPKFQPSSTTCRTVAGDCDVLERCTGNTTTCPTDGFVSGGTTCRPVAGDCDLAEACTGNGPACPSDGFVSGGTVCRGSAGDCDVTEACSGNAATCPADAAQPAGTACGGAPNGDCDAQDTCSGNVGASATCVPRFLPSSTTCRAANGDCDVAENCTGSTTTCPTNGFAPQGTGCADGSACTAPDLCDGSGACSAGAMISCNDDNPCTADSCDPAQGCVTVAVANGTACNDANACTSGDSCQSGACVAGVTVDCDDNSPCTIDSCDTDMACQHVNAPSNTTCNDGSACTTNDHCSQGTCGGTTLDCADDNECTEDVCQPQSGCVHPARNGQPCADGAGTCRVATCELDPTGEGGAGATPGTGGMSGNGATAGRGAISAGGTSSGGTSTGGASSGGASGAGPDEGGAAGEAGGAGEGGEGAVRPPRPPVTTRTGCKCDVVGQKSNAANHAWLAALALAAVAVRRRSRSVRSC
jgi:subtilisin-like proprotein convertase family protein